MSEIKCPTVLLSDDPTTEDQFRSHARVAAALVDLVRGEPGGRSIGLVGAWGSGKTSVVRIAEKLAGGTANFFVFDAWAHQGDPLRRVFIEKAIQYFEQKGWIQDRPKWTKEKEKLAGRLEERQSTTSRKLTPAGKVIAIVSVVLAVSFQMFSAEKLSANGLAYRLDVYALIAMATSVLLIAWTLVASDTRGDSWGMLLDKKGGTTLSETSRTIDPTSVEFQDLFAALLDECISVRKEPFVIAIDNLDRVTQSDALTIWATLRAFSELQSFANRSWTRHVWLLVPFAPDILKSWALEETPATGGNSRFDRAFLAKNFQVVFHVPPPVLADWQDFVLQQLGLALPRHDSVSLQDVVRVVRLPMFADCAPSTPREIKLFVNRLGAIHRQWGDDVPLQIQALYLLLVDSGRDVEGCLRQPTESDVIGIVPQGLIGADWRDWVAALYYNIPKEDALHVLLGDKILGALQQGDASYFESQGSIPGVLRVLSDLIDYRLMGWSQDGTAMVALAARSIRGLDKTDPLVVRSRGRLCDALRTVSKWSALNAQVADGLLAMMEWRDSREFAAIVISAIEKATPQAYPVSGPGSEDFVQAWGEALFAVACRIKALHPDLIPTLKTSSVNTQFYFQIARVIVTADRDSEIPELLNPTAPDAVLGQLQGQASQAVFGLVELKILRAVLKKYPSSGFDGIAGSLSVLLNPNNNVAGDMRRASLLALLSLSARIKAAQDMLRSLVQRGDIYSCFAALLNTTNRGAKDEEGVAACFLAILLYRQPTNASFPDMNQQGARFYDSTLRQATDEGLIARICALAASLGLTEQLSQVQALQSEYSRFYDLVRERLRSQRANTPP